MKRILRCFVVCFSVLQGQPAFAREEAKMETFRAVTDADGRQRVRLLGGSYFFRPGRIIVKVNVPVELSASLEPGIVPHTLVIDAPEAGIVIDASLGTDAKTFVFTPTLVGEHPFYCRNKLLFFKSHREKGMEGVLEVVE